MNNNKILAIIQARLGSTRLPKKVFKKLCGKTVLEHVIERTKYSKYIDDIIVATTISKDDLEIVHLCSKKGIRVFVGSEDDVLDRFYQAAKLLNPNHIVRITSDCPLIDYKIIDKVIQMHINKGADYTSNILKETYPDGLDVEVFTFKALKKAWEEANLLSEREHVTSYIRKNPKKFVLVNLENKINLNNKRWTLDTKEDYIVIKKIYNALYPRNMKFTMEDILNYINKHPEVEKLNSHIVRNEGYIKSIINDRRIK